MRWCIVYIPACQPKAKSLFWNCYLLKHQKGNYLEDTAPFHHRWPKSELVLSLALETTRKELTTWDFWQITLHGFFLALQAAREFLYTLLPDSRECRGCIHYEEDLLVKHHKQSTDNYPTYSAHIQMEFIDSQNNINVTYSIRNHLLQTVILLSIPKLNKLSITFEFLSKVNITSLLQIM